MIPRPQHTRHISPAMGHDPDDWRRRGVCNDHDPELWFPNEKDLEGVRRAKDRCGTCPVRDTCAEWAIDNRESFGVWGGLSEDERRSILRKRDRKRETRRTEQRSRAQQLTDSAHAHLDPTERYTCAQVLSILGLPTTAGGPIMGSLCRTGTLVRDGSAAGYSGKSRVVPAYRLVAS